MLVSHMLLVLHVVRLDYTAHCTYIFDFSYPVRSICSLIVQNVAYVTFGSFREPKHSRMKACAFSAVTVAGVSVTSSNNSMGPPKCMMSSVSRVVRNMPTSVSFVLLNPPRPTEVRRLMFSSRRQESIIDMNGQPLFLAAASYSRAVLEPITSDDWESVKM